MDERDQELFLEMLLKLDGSHESIKAASKWCRANAQYHQDIVKMWFFAVAKSRTMIRRLDLFHLVSDILFTTETNSIQYFSSFLPQLIKAVSFVRGEEIKLQMRKLFLLWREKNIYNGVVMDHLNKLLRNRNKVVDMNIFRYDSDLLFRNLLRVQELKPACDYLIRGIENSSNFDNSQGLLNTIKERRTCQSLLSAVDAHKTKTTTLVAHLEETVHLLKMATVALDIAANREQNGIEEIKLKIMAYGRFKDKVLSLLHMLESNYNLQNHGSYRPPTITDSEAPSGLFSRRSGGATFADSPMSPYSSGWSTPVRGGGFAPPNFTPEPLGIEIFHRRDPAVQQPAGSLTPQREEVAPWYPPPQSPSYVGSSDWGAGSSSYNASYRPYYTGINQVAPIGNNLIPIAPPQPPPPLFSPVCPLKLNNYPQ